ncbi:MAG TPA: orotidine-5'-phosphate decarboxylase [Candidatus Bathyarchaeia archaeon]|nr:orotidine-5'-phosphate decarboxylase [Candidatus Bathyarchaeia archaeon]
MGKNKFITKLEKVIKKNNSLVCVGLDSDTTKIPPFLRKYKDRIFTFNKEIIDATYDLVCAYKPNIAFYEAEGIKGLKALKKTIDYLRKKYPEIPIILDAKRGDIDNTNLGYIKYIFEDLKVDAVTLHPYLGKLALLPFLNLKDKFLFILCRTSNTGAGEFQDLMVKHSKLGLVPFYQVIAYQVAKYWNKHKNCGLVIGATYPDELKIVRKIVGKILLLIPGIGAQGGSIEKTLKAGDGNMIINSSRSIIFASSGNDFAEAARRETQSLKNKINKYR